MHVTFKHCNTLIKHLQYQETYIMKKKHHEENKKQNNPKKNEEKKEVKLKSV